MTFGEAIKKRREELGLTQQDLAEKLFVSRQTVCRWENGTRCPDLIMAKKISMLLGISVDDLITADAAKDYIPPKEPIIDDDLPQRHCPQCGKDHDFDYPKCPYCDYDYTANKK